MGKNDNADDNNWWQCWNLWEATSETHRRAARWEEGLRGKIFPSFHLISSSCHQSSCHLPILSSYQYHLAIIISSSCHQPWSPPAQVNRIKLQAVWASSLLLAFGTLSRWQKVFLVLQIVRIVNDLIMLIYLWRFGAPPGLSTMIRGDLPGFPKLLATRIPHMASGLILHCCWIFIIRLDDDKNKNEENFVLVMVSIVGDVGGDDGGGDHDGGDDLGEDVCN